MTTARYQLWVTPLSQPSTLFYCETHLVAYIQEPLVYFRSSVAVSHVQRPRSEFHICHSVIHPSGSVKVTQELGVGRYKPCFIVGRYPPCLVVGRYPPCFVVGRYPPCFIVGRYPLCFIVGRYPPCFIYCTKCFL